MVKFQLEFVEIEIIVITVLIGLYALFSGLEIAIVGTRRSKVMRLYRKKVRGSTSLYKLKSNPSRMTSSVNLGNTLVNVASSVLAADVAIKLLGNQGVGIAIGIMTFSILIFGEILPKTYSNIQSEKVALRFSNFLLAFTYVMYPFVLFLEQITKLFLRFVGGYSYPKPITEEDIKERVRALAYDISHEYYGVRRRDACKVQQCCNGEESGRLGSRPVVVLVPHVDGDGEDAAFFPLEGGA